MSSAAWSPTDAVRPSLSALGPQCSTIPPGEAGAQCAETARQLAVGEGMREAEPARAPDAAEPTGVERAKSTSRLAT
jgi:hypothetical protein